MKDNKLYGGSFIDVWRKHLDIKARRQSLSKEEKALRELISAKHHLQSKLDALRWIPVSERLPKIKRDKHNEASKKVWLIFQNKPRIGYYTNFTGWIVDGIRFHKRMNQQDITHWMEIPTLPEPDDGKT